MPAVVKNLSPFKPWQHAKQSALVFYHRLQGGGDWGALYTSPWGTYDTFKYVFSDIAYPKPPHVDSGSLEVGLSEAGVQGFALYGLVRVGGLNVIPPMESEE